MNGNAYSTELTVREINDLFEDDSTYVETDIDRNNTTLIGEAYHDFSKALIRIEKFVARVLSDDDPAFVMTERLIERNDLKIVKKYLERLPLARHFTHVIELFEYYSPEYEYSLHVDLFFKCCFELELGKEYFNKPLAYTSKQGKQAFELYNGLLDLIRIESRTAEFNGKISDREYNAIRNFKSAAPFVTSLFTCRLLVLRVDLYYQPIYANNVSAEEAKRDLAHFFNNFRRNKELTKHLDAYLWKMEFAPKKKIHTHFLFFYYGQKVQNDAYWANKIGAYWVDVITKGRGKFYNGNTKKNKAKFEKKGLLGIGMIDRINNDPNKDTGKAKRAILLNKIVKYILKPTQYLLANKLGHSKDRIYGKGYGPYRRHRKMKVTV